MTHPVRSPPSKPDTSDSAAVLEAFKFIESAAAEFSDEDEEEDSEGRDKTILDLAAVRLPRSLGHVLAGHVTGSPDQVSVAFSRW